MKKIALLLLVCLLAACSGAGNEPQTDESANDGITYETDEETGLPFNPSATLSQSEFILEGELVDFSLIPQDKPVFKVSTPDGVVYEIVSQSLAEVGYENGDEIAPHEFRKGMMVRATVWQGEATGAQGAPAVSSENLVILVDTE